jgi:heptosyltransferase I
LKVLILKPSSLGDVIHALPVARLLRRHFPGAEIHWWLNRELIPLLERDPDIRRLVPFDRKRWARPAGWGVVVGTLRDLRAEHYDWVLDLQSLARSSVVGWLACGRFTAGLRDWREGAPLLYDIAIPRPSPQTHAVDWYLELLRHLNVPVDRHFEWLPENPDGATLVRSRWPQLTSGRWIALQPGARWHNKRWPAESYRELARRLLAQDPNLQIAVLGGRDEAALAETIVTIGSHRVLNLAGRQSLPELVETLRSVDLLVTNDTGPMHIAVALGKPVVALFGPTDPRRTGPYGQLNHVLHVDGLECAPCLKARCRYHEPIACLTRLSVDRVTHAVHDRLKAL